MLAVKLWGGLGNQMFQYAFGKYLKATRHDEVSFYKIPFNSKSDSNLSNFKTDLKTAPIRHLKDNLILPPREYSYRTERKIVQKFPYINPRLHVENSLRFNPEINQKAVIFDGYWQSYKYFEGISDLIKKEFQPWDIFLLNMDLMLAEISSCSSVSMHIRRGDYLSKNNQELFYPLGRNYIESSIKKVQCMAADPCFFIFSNDINWVKKEQEMFSGLKYRIIDNAAMKNSTLADFVLMSRCKHNIISNSTFSWWAAWLNPNPDKIVIAPSNWYNGKLNVTTSDLIPPTWIRV